MENKEPKNQPVQDVEEAQDIISRAKANSKMIIGLTAFVFAVIAASLIWYFVDNNNSKKADEAVALADIEQNDSISLQLYKDAAEFGHKSGNRAKVVVATRLYQDGKYEEALEYLKDASIKDNVVKAGVYTLMGDCYVNLKNYPDALKAYDKAVSAADENPQIAPLILFKKANVYRADKNYAEEYEALKEIVENYPQFDRTTQTDIQKYYERAKAAAGK